ncbi:uncharacterized protein [Antedon mediterranea]|uniref:uncharacterized protein n=1 Tax=Antedon mediterranea TaxID=105859 RepID=UPI003AF50D57
MVNIQWSEAATVALISIWGDAKIQNGLDGTRRNGLIYADIKKRLTEIGFTFDLTQITNKCKNLKRQYLEAKDEQGRSGNGPTEWPYFDEMNAIFGDRPATKPAFVAGSSLPLTTSRPSSATPTRPTSSHTTSSSISIRRPTDVNAATSSRSANLILDHGFHEGGKPTCLDDSGLGDLVDGDVAAQSTAQPNNKKRKVESTRTSGKKAKKDLVSELSDVLLRSNREFQAQILEQQNRAMESRREYEREREERAERRMMEMQEMAAEKQLKMIEALGKMMKPTVPQQPYPQQPYPQQPYPQQPYPQQPYPQQPSTNPQTYAQPHFYSGLLGQSERPHEQTEQKDLHQPW